MGLILKKTTDPVVKPVFQYDYEDYPGGFQLVRDGFAEGKQFAEKGTPVEVDLENRTATLVKTAEIHAAAGGTDTEYQVKKNHNFKVGDKIGNAVGGKAYAISAIDTSNADYDVLTVGTTLGALAEGDVLIESSASGATACAEAHIANGLLRSSVNIEDANVSASVVSRGQVIEKNLPYPLHAKNKESLTARFSFI